MINPRIQRLFVKKLMFFIMMMIMGFPTWSQVVIDNTDMPKPGDTLRVSQALSAPEGYIKTAFDTAWNFSMLEALSQRVDTFINATSAPAGYQLVFVLLGGANLASPRSDIPVPNLPLSQGFTFYKNDPTAYQELGSAYSLSGFPIPAKYDLPDKIYAFPLSPMQTWNSTSTFELPIPGFLYYRTILTRENVVDGSGSLTTPFGTFPALRVKSMVSTNDSIYIDSLQAGFTFTRNFTEYKWLGKGQGLPLLNVRKEGGLTSSTWRDIPRMSAEPLRVSVGNDTSVAKGTYLQITALASGGTPPYSFYWNTLESNPVITVQILGDTSFTVVVMDGLMNMAVATKKISIRYPPGMGEAEAGSLLITPNPNSGTFAISCDKLTRTAFMSLCTVYGAIVRSGIPVIPGQANLFDFSDIPDGLYIVKIDDGGRTCISKMLIYKR